MTNRTPGSFFNHTTTDVPRMNRYYVETSFGDGGEQSVQAWPEDQTDPLKKDYARDHSWGGWVETEGGAYNAIVMGLWLAEQHFQNRHILTPAGEALRPEYV